MTSTIYRDTPREQPQAIATIYKGYRFRSRLEARWAVFFDNASFAGTWQCEHEGYVLPSGWYLPDFEFTHKRDRSKFFIEVKPQSAKPTAWSRELTLAEELSRAFNKAPVTVVYGSPLDVVIAAAEEQRLHGYRKDGKLHNGAVPLVDDNYDPEALSAIRSSAHVALGGDILGGLARKAALWDAATIARQARFEHGECP